VNGSLDEQSQMCRMAGMVSAAIANSPIPQNPNRRLHSHEKNRGAMPWPMIVTVGTGGTKVEIDATTTVVISEEMMLGPIGEMTVTRATAEATALPITETA
jgi:hypothetical protein